MIKRQDLLIGTRKLPNQLLEQAAKRVYKDKEANCDEHYRKLTLLGYILGICNS